MDAYKQTQSHVGTHTQLPNSCTSDTVLKLQLPLQQ